MDTSTLTRLSAPARLSRLLRRPVLPATDRAARGQDFHGVRTAMHPRWIAALWVLQLPWLVSCDDPRPPFACDTIGEQTLHVGDVVTVTPCFEDPDMDEITLSAESSDLKVVTAGVRQDGVVLRGVTPGTATITVTATDPGMLSGTTSFEALVPNRAPELEERIRSVRLIPGGAAGWNLNEHFSDPDGQDLSFSAVSTDTAVAMPSAGAAMLTVVAGTAGTASITVTATDPGGLTASQRFAVTVVEPVRLLRDDFDSNESLDDWLFTDTRRRVVDGRLRMTSNNADALALARTPLRATEWEVTASMGNGTADSWVQIMMFTRHNRYTAYAFQLGVDNTGTFDDITGEAGTNYRFLVWDAQGGQWTAPPDSYGTSDAVKDVNELMEVSFSAQRGHFSATVGGERLFMIPHGGYPDEVVILSLAVWPLLGTTGKVGDFDWVQVYGVRP